MKVRLKVWTWGLVVSLLREPTQASGLWERVGVMGKTGSGEVLGTESVGRGVFKVSPSCTHQEALAELPKTSDKKAQECKYAKSLLGEEDWSP